MRKFGGETGLSPSSTSVAQGAFTNVFPYGEGESQRAKNLFRVHRGEQSTAENIVFLSSLLLGISIKFRGRNYSRPPGFREKTTLRYVLYALLHTYSTCVVLPSLLKIKVRM